MKKRDLLKILENIADDQEILIYNGYVQDYNDIECAVPVTLYKHTIEEIERGLVYDHWRDTGEQNPSRDAMRKIKKTAKKLHKESEFEYFDFIPQYKKETKSSVFLQMKERDIKTFDRCGTLCY